MYQISQGLRMIKNSLHWLVVSLPTGHYKVSSNPMCLHLPDTGIREFFCILICGDGCLILFSKEMLPCTQEAIIFLLLACKQETLSVQLSYRFFQVYKVILLFCLTIQMRMDTPQGLSI